MFHYLKGKNIHTIIVFSYLLDYRVAVLITLVCVFGVLKAGTLSLEGSKRDEGPCFLQCSWQIRN
jgi:hypothetical protein